MPSRLIRPCAAALLVAAAGCTAIFTPAVSTQPVAADVDFSELERMKQGEVCALTVLHIFGPMGAASVAEAARAGGLTRVRYAENRIRNYFLWQKYCVVAYGE